MNALLLVCLILSTLPINSFAIDDDDKPQINSQNFTKKETNKYPTQSTFQKQIIQIKIGEEEDGK